MRRGLLIDDRERALISRLAADSGAETRASPAVSVGRLAVGDVHITADDAVVFVLERKTRQDLVASLRDGRFHEQRERMVAAYGAANVAYVVEGATDWSSPESGAEIALLLRDRVPVFWTRDVADTAELVRRLCRCDLRARAEPPRADLRIRSARAPAGDPVRALAAMLRCVDGVSARRAERIAAEFGSVRRLVQVLMDDRAGATARIAETRESSGRRLGRCLADRVASCMCGPEEADDAAASAAARDVSDGPYSGPDAATSNEGDGDGDGEAPYPQQV